MLSFIFKSILFFVLLGVVFTLFCQRRPRDAQVVAPPSDPADARTTPAVILVPVEKAPDGPAEKVGQVLDEVLHHAGEAAIEAGKSIKEMTEDSVEKAPTAVVVPLEGATPPVASPDIPTSDSNRESALDEVEEQLDSLPPPSPAPAVLEEF